MTNISMMAAPNIAHVATWYSIRGLGVGPGVVVTGRRKKFIRAHKLNFNEVLSPLLVFINLKLADMWQSKLPGLQTYENIIFSGTLFSFQCFTLAVFFSFEIS